jgi:hypothetical protein
MKRRVNTLILYRELRKLERSMSECIEPSLSASHRNPYKEDGVTGTPVIEKGNLSYLLRFVW